MKRPISLILLLAMLLGCLLLSGCHGERVDAGKSSELSFTVPESFDESRRITVTFWAKNDSNKVQVGIYRQAEEDFEALYPNVDVNIRYYTDYGSIYNDVITNIPTKTTPNVCITYPDHIATYMTGKNVVMPLEELAADPNYGLGGAALKFDSPAAEELVVGETNREATGAVDRAAMDADAPLESVEMLA